MKILSIAVSRRKGTRKQPVTEAQLVKGHGLKDAVDRAAVVVGAGRSRLARDKGQTRCTEEFREFSAIHEVARSDQS